MGFEIPKTIKTKDPKEIYNIYKKWRRMEIFQDIPCDGIVVKVNSIDFQKALGETDLAPNWALAMK